MNFFRARHKGGAIGDRPFGIVCPAWTTQKRWVSTSFTFRLFIQLGALIEKAEITRPSANPAIQACHGRSAAKLADTRRSNLHLGHWKISTGFKKRCANAEWKLPSISRLIVRRII